MTTRIRNPNPSFETIVRRAIGPKTSKKIARLAHLHGVSWMREWNRVQTQGRALIAQRAAGI